MGWLRSEVLFDLYLRRHSEFYYSSLGNEENPIDHPMRTVLEIDFFPLLAPFKVP